MRLISKAISARQPSPAGHFFNYRFRAQNFCRKSMGNIKQPQGIKDMNQDKASLFELTKQTIREAERVVLEANPAHNFFLNLYLGRFFTAYRLVGVGLSELVRPFVLWVILGGSFVVACMYLSPAAENGPAEQKLIIAGLWYLFSFPLVYLTVPSKYVFDSMTSRQIEVIGTYIYHLGIDSKDKIEAFEESIANVFERAYVRVKMFQLTMAAGWAYYLYCLNQSNNVLLKIDSLQSLQAIRVASIDFGFFTLLMICMVLLIISYKKGIDAMSRRIHFAIQELKYRVAVENEK